MEHRTPFLMSWMLTHSSNNWTVSLGWVVEVMHRSWVTVSMVGTAMRTPPSCVDTMEVESDDDAGTAESKEWMSLMLMTLMPKALAHSAMILHLER